MCLNTLKFDSSFSNSYQLSNAYVKDFGEASKSKLLKLAFGMSLPIIDYWWLEKPFGCLHHKSKW